MPIIADAGINYDKDIFLAIACGASTIMSGGIFSGTDESPGQIIDDPSTGQKFKFYRGMTSPEAVIAGAYDEDEVMEKLSTPAEGQSKKVPYVGSVGRNLETNPGASPVSRELFRRKNPCGRPGKNSPGTCTVPDPANSSVKERIF